MVYRYQPRFLLASFLYLRKTPEVLRQIKPDFFILDSGAHTLQKPGKDVDYDRFVFEYARFVKEYSNFISEYVELDIENKVGLKQVEKWRNYLRQVTGRSPIVVWHRERGKDYWLYMIKKYPYVGFSGFVVTPDGGKEVPERYIPWFVKTAHEYGAKIHGFGLTKMRILFKIPFDSIDSCNWTASERYRNLHIFDGEKIKTVERKRDKATGVDVEKIIEYSFLSWLKFQEYIYNYWRWEHAES